jgi:hypothetical protein
MVPPVWRLRQAFGGDQLPDSTDEQCLTDMERFFRNPFRLRRRIISRFFVDIVLMLCMGALFPPLAWVITISVLFDIWWTRLSMNRLKAILASSVPCEFINRLAAVQKKFRFDLSSAVPTLWKGVCVFVGIWAFVLYDISSTELSLKGSLILVCLMLVIPYPLYSIWKYRQNKKQKSLAIFMKEVIVHANPIHNDGKQRPEEEDGVVYDTKSSFVSSSRFSMNIE